MTSKDNPGLRDRKRAETRARIEVAAVDLAAEVGLDAATVELISERAGVSPRTFFNYFETKDAAILGLRPGDLDEEVLEEHVATTEDDPVVAMVRLVMTVTGTVDADRSALHRRRVELLRAHPEIVGSQFAHLDARKSRLFEYARRLLVQHPRFADDPDVELRAGIVLATCGSAVRAAIDEWTHNTSLTKPKNADQSDESAAVEARAVELVHTTLRSLA